MSKGYSRFLAEGLGIVLVVSLTLVTTAHGQGTYQAVPELQNMVPSDITSSDESGRAVAVDGDVIVVGARYANGITSDDGAVYLFRFDGHTWNEQQKLFAWDGQPSNEFGHSVAIQGDIIVVGARRGDSPTVADSGSAYIFRRYGTNWLPEAKLAGSDKNGAEFGYAVDLQGGRVIVGALHDDGADTGTGAAYVYRYTGGAWSFEQKLFAQDGARDDGFGGAVAIDGNTVAVGAYLDWSPLNWAGSAYIFGYDGSQWIHEQKLIPANSQPDDRFGVSLDLDGEWLIVGAYRADTFTLRCDQGLAYIFFDNGSLWVEQSVLTPPDPGCGYGFGLSVAMENDLAVVGSFLYELWSDRRGAAYAYRRAGQTWIPEVKFLAAQGQPRDMFGTSVAVSGETVAVGAFQDDATAQNTGSAYAYMGPQWERYGEGTPGKDGVVPVIRASGTPYLGNQQFGVEVSQTYPSTVGLLLLGFFPLWRDANGWNLLVDIEGPPRGTPIFIILSSAGNAAIDLPIPNNPYFDGLGLYMQALVADPFAPDNIATTAGLKLSMYHQ